jgi:cell division protein FtsL
MPGKITQHRPKSQSKIYIKQQKKKFSFGNFFISIGLMSLIGFLGYQLVGVYQKKYTIEQEKAEFRAQIAQIQQESEELSQIKEYITTRQFQEREARQRLDLQFPDEQVRILTPGSIVDNLTDEELVRVLREPRADERLKAQTNPQKWWAFFFDKARL